MNFDLIQDWWWLILAIIAVIVSFVKYTIKIHEAVEGLKRVAEHDKRLTAIQEQYKTIEGDTKDLKIGMAELSASLEKHIVEQKEDFRSINIAVYAMLDILKKIGGNGEAEAAHQELRKHTLGK